MAAAHSPGPWSAGRSLGHHAVHLPDGRIAAYCGGVGADDDAESRANALLIAASPKMLEALAAIVKRVTEGASYRMGSDIHAIAAAAIAQVKGEKA